MPEVTDGPLSCGARRVLKDAVDYQRNRSAGAVDDRHVIHAIVKLTKPDPCARLIESIGIDSHQILGEL